MGDCRKVSSGDSIDGLDPIPGRHLDIENRAQLATLPERHTVLVGERSGFKTAKSTGSTRRACVQKWPNWAALVLPRQFQ
jgi:hypothetical protein